MTVLLAVTLSSVLVMGLGAVPTAAIAQRLDGKGGDRGGDVGRLGRPRPIAPPSFVSQRQWPPRFGASGPGHHPFGSHPFRRHLHVGSPVHPYWPVVYGAPAPSYDAPPVYDPPVYYYDQSRTYGVPGSVSVSVAPPPPSPPSPTVIQHPNGRYELRGDGLTTPYTWVWVPNPPNPPPADGSTGRHRPGPTRLYTWTDREGVVHYTDQAESVPAEYRARTKQKDL